MNCFENNIRDTIFGKNSRKIRTLLLILPILWICRATDIEHWRRALEKTLKEVNAEIQTLHAAKEECERNLEAKALPSDVTTECMSIREVRRWVNRNCQLI